MAETTFSGDDLLLTGQDFADNAQNYINYFNQLGADLNAQVPVPEGIQFGTGDLDLGALSAALNTDLSALPDNVATAMNIMIVNDQTGEQIPLWQALVNDPQGVSSFINEKVPSLATVLKQGGIDTAAHANTPTVGGAAEDVAGGATPGTGAGNNGVPGIEDTPAAAKEQKPLFTVFGYPVTPGMLSGLIGLGTLGIGAAALIQRAVAGDQEAVTTLKKDMESATPEQIDAMKNALEGFKVLGDFATGNTNGLLATLQKLSPVQQQALLDAIGMSTDSAKGFNALTQELLPILGQQAKDITGMQTDLLKTYQPIADMVARGELPLTPEMERLIEQAFSPEMGDIANQAIESARQRGFAGGADLLTSGPGGAIAGPMLAALQGQMAKGKLDVAALIPQLANQAISTYNTPAALNLQGMSNLGNLNQDIISKLGNFGQQGIQNQLNFLGAATAPFTGQYNASQTGSTTTETTTKPYNLIDALAPVASLLTGTSGLIGGLSGTNSNLSGTNPIG